MDTLANIVINESPNSMGQEHYSNIFIILTYHEQIQSLLSKLHHGTFYLQFVVSIKSAHKTNGDAACNHLQ